MTGISSSEKVGNTSIEYWYMLFAEGYYQKLEYALLGDNFGYDNEWKFRLNTTTMQKQKIRIKSSYTLMEKSCYWQSNPTIMEIRTGYCNYIVITHSQPSGSATKARSHHANLGHH